MIDAYKQIAEAIPQLTKLKDAFFEDERFQVVLSLVYQDILEFHRAAYRFFRRRSWQIFFDALWKGFQFRFRGILRKLEQHQQLLLKHVTITDLTEAKDWRQKTEDEIKHREKETKDSWFHDSLSWLKVSRDVREDELEELAEKRHEGTCEWVFRNTLFKNWKDDAHAEPILWVKGIPGAGCAVSS